MYTARALSAVAKCNIGTETNSYKQPTRVAQSIVASVLESSMKSSRRQSQILGRQRLRKVAQLALIRTIWPPWN